MQLIFKFLSNPTETLFNQSRIHTDFFSIHSLFDRYEKCNNYFVVFIFHKVHLEILNASIALRESSRSGCCNSSSFKLRSLPPSFLSFTVRRSAKFQGPPPYSNTPFTALNVPCKIHSLV